jgi:hypothetical protein
MGAEGTLNFRTGSTALAGGTTALTLDTSQNATFAGNAHILEASSGGTANAAVDNLVIEGSGSVGMTFLAGSSDFSRIYFGDSVNNNKGQITYRHDTDLMSFYTDQTLALSIDTAQNATFAGTLQVIGGISTNGGSGTIQQGNGSPEGAITAIVGSIWMQLNGSAGATLYVKESGTGNTGWSSVS